MIDAINWKTYQSNDAQFDYQEMFNILELCSSGICLPNKLLLKVMGKENLALYLNGREEFYSKWRQENFGHENFPINNLNELMEEAGLE